MTTPFDSLYSIQSKVNASELEMVRSFFVKVCPSQQIAESFTALVFRIVARTGKPTFEVLKIFQTMDQSAMTLTEEMAYYLNSMSDSKTNMYGISAPMAPVASINRNIIQ